MFSPMLTVFIIKIVQLFTRVLSSSTFLLTLCCAQPSMGKKTLEYVKYDGRNATLHPITPSHQ